MRIALLLVMLFLPDVVLAQEPVKMRVAAPEFTGIDEWLNAKPLAVKDLKGQVVVVHFWAFGCINCQRNLDAYAGWHKDFEKQGVKIIGIHTPESVDEAKPERVRQKVKDNAMTYPIAIDTQSKTWKAWDNRWWPCVYLIDKKGFVRYRWDGELNWKGSKGEATMRGKIEELLRERE